MEKSSGDSRKILPAAESAFEGNLHQKTEKALRESEAKYRRLFESMMDAFARIDMNGRLVEFNRPYQDMLGYPEEELLRLTYRDLTPPKWHAFEADIVEKQVLGRGHSEVYEKEYRKKDGTVFPVELRTFLLRDEAGNPTGMWSIARDISDRKRVEEALITSEVFLNSIIEQSPHPMWISDDKGTLVRLNRACRELLHLSDEEVIGKYNVLRDNIVEQQGFMPMVRRVFENGETARFELTYDSSQLDGLQLEKTASVVLEVTIFPIRDANGKLTNAVIQHVDSTERRRAEAERAKLESRLMEAQKMESVGRLAGGVAHDFNNMLTVILGYTELLKSELGTESPLYKDVLEIEAAAGHSRDVTRQLLAFSRKQIVTPRLMNLNDVIGDSQKILFRLIGEDIDLRIRPGKGLWTIKFDHSQMDQILVNLVVNARDAMPNGGVLVLETENASLDEKYCADHAECVPGDYVCLSVGDNGCGMDAETIAHIFEPFFTTKDIGKGSGLGLATVYGIAKQNGGFILVNSARNLGTTFRLFIPRSLETESETERMEQAPAAQGTETVLLVEDDAMVSRMTTMMLTTLGYSVICADSPHHALDLVKKKKPPIDILITDVVMPEMSGDELKKRIERRRPGVKTLFMSGYTSNVIVNRGVLEKGVHFIQKPFSRNDLTRKIRETLEDRKAPSDRS